MDLQQQDTITRLEPLKKGDYVVLQVSVQNCEKYPFSFVIARVIGNLTGLDTTHPDTLLDFQVYRPCALASFDSKLVLWVGDTNIP